MERDGMERRILGIASGLLLMGMLLHLGKQPLYLEEPRRALIAMEMWERGNPWTPTELGDHYYNKPPFFNWVLMGSAALWGGFHEWAMRLPTVLSTIGIALLVFFTGRRYVDDAFGWVSGLLFVSCGSVLLFFSHLGEIDLFYAFVSFAGFVALFHFQQRRRFGLMFVAFYALHAVGFLTKGLPSVVFIALTLPAWLWYKNEFRRLFSWAHAGGIAVFAGIAGGYLFMYSRYQDLAALLPVWVGQAGERTVADQGWRRLWLHLVHYPLDSLKDLLPFSLLLVFAVRRDIKLLLLRNEWIVFSVLAFAVNFPVYWFSPGARQRYLYMLFPFVLIALTWAWRHAGEVKPWRSRFFRTVTGIFLALLCAAAPALGFVPDLAFLPWRHVLAAGAALTFGALLYFFLKRKGMELHCLILAMALLRMAFDLTVLPQRAHASGAQRDKDLAAEIAGIAGRRPLYIWQDDRISFTTVYYLNRLRGQCLVRNHRKEDGAYYLAEQVCIPAPYLLKLEFEFEGRKYLLFQFE